MYKKMTNVDILKVANRIVLMKDTKTKELDKTVAEELLVIVEEFYKRLSFMESGIEIKNKTSPAEDLREWVVDNFGNEAFNDVIIIARQFAKENAWDVVEVDYMAEEIVEKLQEGILNVIETYEEEK
ncbi:MAG: hypothetical protein RBR71_03665 [Gudongella sp.]|nr:hypothetical protein [Gudongella sp.]